MNKSRFKLIFVLIVSLAAASAFAEPVSFYIEPQLDVSISKNDEYILSVSGKRVVSYLEWLSEPAIYACVKTGINVNGFSLCLSGDFAIPAYCGKMYDSDWNSSGIKTTYSIHENNTVQNYKLNAAFSYAFAIRSFRLEPKLSFLYLYDSFHAQNGYGWYGGQDYSKNGLDNSWDSEYARKAKKLYPIDLQRTNTFTFLGLDVGYSPIGSLDFALGFAVALHNHTHSYDYHHAAPDSLNDFSMTEIQDTNLNSFKTDFSFIWRYDQTLSITFSAIWLYTLPSIGILYDYDTLVTQKSASSLNSLSLKTGIRVDL